MSFHEGAIRVETGGFAPWAHARGRRLGADGVNRCDEAVSPLRHSLDVRRPGAIVPERLPEIRYRLRQRVLGDHDVRPERLKQFLFGNKRRRPGDEVVEEVDQFRRERHWHIAALERERSGVQREGTEPVQHGDDSKPKSPAGESVENAKPIDKRRYASCSRGASTCFARTGWRLPEID
jgi:hypothetical protein